MASSNDGTWLALAAALGLTAAATLKRRGSASRLGEQDGIDMLAFRDELGFRPAMSIPSRRHRGSTSQSQVLRQGRARANAGQMWSLLSERMYGSWVDMPSIATRETLQNSRDAINQAWRERKISKEGGRFEVDVLEDGAALEWRDNGIGMSEDVVYDKFLDLGETTKGAGGSGMGGFGIAKAVILGLSSTFRWELHTRDRRYVANGFSEPIRAYSAPFYQGTKLTVYDIDPKYRYFSLASGGYEDTSERLKVLLAANNLQSSRNQAGIKVFLNGTEIKPMFRGRGRLLGADLNWGPGTTATAKAYRRKEGSGATYVRLEGLYQYAVGFDTKVPFDLTIDLTTTITPREDNYPLTANRNQLSGPPAMALRSLRRDLTEDVISATMEKSTIEFFGEDEGDPQEVESNREVQGSLMASLLNDPDVARALARVKGGAERLRESQRELQERRLLRDAAEIQQSYSQGQTARPPSAQAPRNRVGVSQQRVAPQKRRRRTNPFAGIAVFKVNRKHFKGYRVRKYFDNPAKWFPMLTLWRLTCLLVLQELQQTAPAFHVGLLLDDDISAEYENDANIGRILFINPEWASTEIKAYKTQPLAIAAIFHAKACHEITHLLGKGSHDEAFVILREQVQDETIGLLYPLGTLVERILPAKAKRRRKAPSQTSTASLDLDSILNEADRRVNARGSANRNIHEVLLGKNPHDDCPGCRAFERRF